MKKFLLSFFALLSIVISAQAQTYFEVGGLRYRVWQDPWEENPGQVYVAKSSDEMAEYSGDIVIPPTVTYTKTYNVIGIESQAFKDCSGITSVIIGDNVTDIQDRAFSGCDKLASLTIGTGVTNISWEVFKGCESLTTVTIPNSVTNMSSSVFSGCSKLSSVTLSDKLETIEWGTFQNCTSLKSISIPDKVTSIGGSAFSGCSELAEVILGSKLKTIENSVFYNCTTLKSITIPEGVTTIGGSAFNGCTSLSSITIPSTVTRIGGDDTWDGSTFSNCSSLTSITIPGKVKIIKGNTFSNCTSLTSITIPDGVTEIGESAFNGCTSLASITIPNSVKKIGGSAFSQCTSLTSITIPELVTKIEGSTFSNCTSLTSITIPQSVTEIGGSAFWNCTSLTSITIPDGVIKIEGSTFSECKSLSSITIPNSVTEIGGSAFSQCTSLTSITIPDGVTKIEGSTFSGCSKLTSVTLGNQLTAIGEYAFNSCSSLTAITIPGSVTKIERWAFMGCNNLKQVTSKIETPFELESVFDWSVQYATLIVPKDTRTLYKNTEGWKNFAVIFEEGEANYALERTEEGVKYSLRLAEDNSAYYAVTGYSEALKPETVILSVLEECPVKAIGENAFNNCSGLSSITIPNSVTSIGQGAFWGCSNLKMVKSEIVTPFEVDAFNWYNNNNKVILVVPQGSRTAYKDKSGWNSAYIYEEGEPIYDVPDTKTDEQGLKYELRQSDDFGPYYALTEITDVQKTEFVIPTELEGCPVRAIERCNFFQDCKSLTTVTIPGSVKIDCGNPFYGCMKLKDVYVVVQDYAEFCNNKLLGTIENPSYYYDGNTGESTTITYTLHITDNAKNEITDYIIPEGVTTIGKAAFKGYTALSSITIPSSVTSIGDGAFYGCSGLELVKSEISTPFDVKAFEFFAKPAEPSVLNTPILIVPKSSRSAYKGKSGWDFACIYENGETIHDMVQLDKQGIIYTLRQDTNDYSFYYAVTGHTDELDAEIVIPAELDGCPVKAIEGAFDQWSNGGAFKGCNDLTSVKIGKNVTSIGGYAFYGCTSLESITLPKKLESIGDAAFSGEWSNSDYMNHGCAITSIAIPGTVKTIGNEAFSYCRDLATVSFGVDEDGNANLTSIGDYAFRECTFTSIIIPNSVTTIGKGAFMSNGKLTTVTLGDAVKEIKDETFQGCSMLASVTIPDGVSSIGVNAFRWCYTLTSVRIPSSLTSMGELAFEGCPLKSIELPDAFTTIPDNLFKNNNLGYIKLGNNVKKIGKNAFGSTIEGNDGTIVIEIGTSTPPTITKDAFPNLADMLSIINVIVPDEASQTAYGNASVWKDMTFANMKTNVELTVDQQGNIGRELYDDCKVMPAKVVGLKVKGSINADDFQQMRSNFKSLLRLDLSECDITEIPDGAMYGKTQLQELTLPTSLQTIGNKAFMDCPYLTGKLDLPSGVTSIGNSAFEGTNYTSVTLPNKLKTIGNKAFYNLPIKQKLNLPDALTSIGDDAFAETHVSGYVEMPNGMTYLGNGAFRNTQIESTALPDDPKGITSISWGLFQGCTNFKPYPLYIPGTYTRVEAYAFDGCSNLSYVRMSPNLESIGEYAFQNTQVEYLKVPSKVENLPTGVFKNCKSLESLSLPANLKQVGPEALYGCSALRNLSVEATTPPTAERNSLLGVNTDLCLISIPTTSFYDYLMADYWGQFVQMRNDIAVETEGNGEIAFESVVEGEEEEALSRTRGIIAAARAKTRAAGNDEDDDMQMTFANNGSSILIPKGGKIRFVIIPAEAETLVSATLDGEDITSLIDEDGIYTTTADKESAKLVVKFSGSSPTDPSTDPDPTTEPVGETSPITIGKSGKASYCGDESLDFSYSDEIKAYIATGFDKDEGTIWLTRVKDVPAGTPVMIKGVAEKTYNVPVANSQNSYYKNMFVGNTSGAKIQIPETDGDHVNYYLSGDGTFKSVNKSANIGNNKCYLQLPGTFKPAEVGGNQAVTIKSVGKTSYAAPVDLDFTNVQGLKAFTATGYDKSSKTIWLTRVMKVQKGEGVLLKGDEGDYQIPSAAVQSSYMNMFVGNTSGDKIQVQETSADGSMTNFYLKGDGTFVSVNGYVNLGNNKCYLELPTSMVSVASTRGTEKSYKFEEPEVIKLPISFRSIDNDGDGTTAIHETMQSLKEDGVYYTLQGQRVEKPGKGIYIKNGKKVVIR